MVGLPSGAINLQGAAVDLTGTAVDLAGGGAFREMAIEVPLANV